MNGKDAMLAGSHARGHEQRDVSTRPIVFASVVLVALILVAVVSMRLLFDSLLARTVRQSPPANPLALAEGKQLPPEPRLRPQPIEQLRALRAEEEARLHAYRWVDRQRGIVRIPIERAMALIAERGVKRTGEAAPSAAMGAETESPAEPQQASGK